MKMSAAMALNRKALHKILRKIHNRSEKNKTDISDHLITLFTESLNIPSRLIVELGIGDGESTFILQQVANLWGATLISVDIEDCSEVSSFKDRIFVQQDDVSFAGEFPDWCKQRGLVPEIDILFIDTSHLYDHTVAEIKAWFPYLAGRAKVFFHDTNMAETFYRKDGSTGKGWDNERGVIRAIEEFMDLNLDEKQNFVLMHRDWLIRHFSICNGFMILDRFV